MRGLATLLFGRMFGLKEAAKVLVVCTSDASRFPHILGSVRERFSNAQVAYVVPEEYMQYLPEGADKIRISDLKASPLRRSWEIRSRRFDVTVLILTGEPVFRKAKVWAAFTNYRMLLVYNENGDSFSCGADNRMALVRHLRWRLTEKGVPSVAKSMLSVLFFPLGFLYLLFFTSRALLRRRVHMGDNLADEGQYESSSRSHREDKSVQKSGNSLG